MKTHHTLILGITIFISLPVFAVTTFTENFSSGIANWEDNVIGDGVDLSFNSTGGAPGSSPGFISTDFAFSDANPTFGAVLFRAQQSTNASDGSFVGNYLESSVDQISFYVRHSVGTDIDFGLRVATPANFPGFLIPATISVPTGAWTLLTFDIAADNPLNIPEGGGPGFDPVAFATSTLSNVGNLQITASTPTGFETNATPFTFELDAFGVNAIPEPSTALLGLFSLLGFIRRKRH